MGKNQSKITSVRQNSMKLSKKGDFENPKGKMHFITNCSNVSATPIGQLGSKFGYFYWAMGCV